MQTIDHAIALPQPKATRPQRVTGLVVAIVLQVALIWALVEGLNIKVWPITDHRTTVEVIHEKIKPQPPPPPPPGWRQPTEVAPVEPTIPIDNGGRIDQQITTIVGPTIATPYDRMAVAIADSHTTPPYPALALRLGEEGNVWLHLVISPQGYVSEALVVRSSGFDDLDQAARSWIVTHWRYRPALRSGAAVGSESDVQVRFDLRNAR